MRLDIVSLADHLPDPHTHHYNETQAERYRTIVDMAVKADQGGFGAFWLGEHHASAYILPSPQMVLAAIAMKTSQIRLGSGVTLLPNSDMVRVAEEFAELDLLSSGRAEIGFGSGITEHTFNLFGQNVEDAVGMSIENLDLLEKLFTDHEVNWTGKYRAPIKETRIEPRTYTGKPIPVSRATSGSVETVKDAARRGQKLSLLTVVGSFADSKELAQVYRDAYREAGHDPAGMRVGAAAFIHVREDGQKAREYWEPYRVNYFSFGAMLGQAKGATRSLIQRFMSLHLASPTAPQQAQMAGSPSEIVDLLGKAHDDMGGFDEIKLLFDVGGMSGADVLASMDLFIEKVAPQVSKIGA